MASVLDLVKHYQSAIEKYPHDEQKVLKCIDKLFNLGVTVQHLQETGVGRTVNALRKEPGDVGQAARSLVYKWKLMVAAEESDTEEQNNDTSTYNGHGSGKESDDNTQQARSNPDRYEKSSSTKPKDERDMNGSYSGSKRKYHSSEEEDPPKRRKHSSSYSEDDYNRKSQSRSRKDETESDSSDNSQSDESDSEMSEDSQETVRVKQEIKIEPTSDYKSPSSKHSSYSEHTDDKSSIKKLHEPDKHSHKHSSQSKANHSVKSSSKEKSHSSEKQSNHSSSKHSSHNADKHSSHNADKHSSQSSEKHSSHSSDKHSSHSTDKHSSHSTDKHSSHSTNKHSSHSSDKHQSSKEKESSSEKKHKSDHKSDSEKNHKETKSSKHSSSNPEKHRSSSTQKTDNSNEKHKSSSDKHSKSEKHKSSSHSHGSEKEKHKNSSEKESSKHKSKEVSSNGASSVDKHISASKDQSKEKSSSSKSKSSSDKKHSSSSEQKSSEHKSSSSSSKDKSGEKKSSQKSSSSSHKSSSKSSSSSKKEDAPKKKVQINEVGDSDDGIDCGSGASFAEALGMISPAKPKKKSGGSLKEATSPNNDLSPAALLAPTAKLAPLPALEISGLPEISPNYKPRPPPRPLPHFSDEDAMSAVISSKNQRTKVYSGNKVIGKIPSLYEMCVHVLQEHIDALEFTGGVPYEILKPVVDKATPQQLYMLEHFNNYLMEDTDHLWQSYCQKHFRNKQRQEMETWREMYTRCQEEQESKLKSLTANIRIAQEAKKAPIKQTKMAYVDSIAKPPRNIAKKQAAHGTARLATGSPAARVAALAGAPNVLRGGTAARPVAAPASSAAFQKPKKAPLMAKALQIMRGRKR